MCNVKLQPESFVDFTVDMLVGINRSPWINPPAVHNTHLHIGGQVLNILICKKPNSMCVYVDCRFLYEMCIARLGFLLNTFLISITAYMQTVKEIVMWFVVNNGRA